MPKQYDRDYFDAWYRSAGRGPSRSAMKRKVALAVAATEMVLDRKLTSVLDVGCGEGLWQPELQRLRPGSRYAGVDSSSYAVARYGRRRNIRLGSLADLDEVGLEGPYDLIVCSDVLHYVPSKEARRGLGTIAGLSGGLVYLEVYTGHDDIVGDMAGFYRRSAATYRRWFAEAGLVPLGLHCYLPADLASGLTALEHGSGD